MFIKRKVLYVKAFFQALKNRHELEKMNLIREKNEHLKRAVVKFDDYLNRIEKAMDHHWMYSLNIIYKFVKYSIVYSLNTILKIYL